MTSKIIIFDCDSTLSSIEGIDELARIAGDEVRQQIEEMTNAAMEGKIPLESVFAQRLEIIQPTLEQVTNIGKLYIQTVEPSALSAIATLKENGWLPMILSAGYVQAIQPLAEYLSIESIEAVPLLFNPDGSYQDFDRTYPTTRSGGKLDIVHKIRQQYSPSLMVTVGDGVSDLETKPGVDIFIGFGRYAVREKVKAQADYFIEDLVNILSIIPGVAE
jgi:phosphoserine phosphatase